MENAKIIVIGTGAWGAALAVSLHNSSKNVTLWGRRLEHVNEMLATRRCIYLPGLEIPSSFPITNDMNEIAKANVILWVAPVQQSEQLLDILKPYIAKDAKVIICSKGLEIKSKKPLTSIFKEQLDNAVGVLSGPNFADEVAQGLPAASTVAFENLDTAKEVAQILRHNTFRVYAHYDVVGVEIAGALKNVMAIAAGVVMGKKLGQNCLATLITRANTEIGRVLAALGGAPETNQTLAGIGDLILTCSSAKSRNTSLGVALTEGRDLQDILSSRINVTEGVATAKVAFELTQEHNVYAPIIKAVYEILHLHKSVDDVVSSMLSNQQEMEII
jgi:glycerol-3-phosphate dehydrogenase (NAD(P)+)